MLAHPCRAAFLPLPQVISECAAGLVAAAGRGGGVRHHCDAHLPGAAATQRERGWEWLARVGRLPQLCWMRALGPAVSLPWRLVQQQRRGGTMEMRAALSRAHPPESP